MKQLKVLRPTVVWSRNCVCFFSLLAFELFGNVGQTHYSTVLMRWDYNNFVKYVIVPTPLGGGGGTIYSNGFFFVQTILTDRYIHCTSCEWYHLKATPA